MTEEKGGSKSHMLPKFHCEFNPPIDGCGARPKMYIRAFNTGALSNLRKLILTALSHENIPEDLGTQIFENKSELARLSHISPPSPECGPAQAEMKVYQMRKRKCVPHAPRHPAVGVHGEETEAVGRESESERLRSMLMLSMNNTL
jgi:hypothetical protein